MISFDWLNGGLFHKDSVILNGPKPAPVDEKKDLISQYNQMTEEMSYKSKITMSYDSDGRPPRPEPPQLVTIMRHW